MDNCKRCGKCCYLRYQTHKRKCKYLIIFKTGRTACRIYKNRIGHLIGIMAGKTFHCTPREQVHKNFVGCPYNRKEWGEPIE